MKKLIMTVAIVCAAVGAQAVTEYDMSAGWWTKYNYLYNGSTKSFAPNGLSAYLIKADSYSQSSFLSAYVANNGDKALTMSAVGANKFSDGSTLYDYGQVYGQPFELGQVDSDSYSDITAYMVVFNEDKVYISDTSSMSVDPSYDSYSAMVNNQKYEFLLSTDGSKNPATLSSAYDGAGWYTVAPEPTSGLLLLIGMAGLALRRRRA